MIQLSSRQLQSLDQLWDKVVSQFGFRDLTTPFSSLVSSQITTAPMTLWVDGVNGSDERASNSNLSKSEAQPFKTINAAIQAIPIAVQHRCTINVRRGTYAETLRDQHIYTQSAGFNATILVKAVDWDTYTPAAGPATGTLGALPATGIAVAVAGGAWTVNEMRGKFIRMTSGALAGNWYPIAGNAAASLDLPIRESALVGCTFEFITPAVILTTTPGEFASAIISNSGSSFASNGLTLQGLAIQPSTFYACYMQSGSASLVECSISTYSVYGTLLANICTNFTARRCYYAGVGGSKSIIASDLHGSLFLDSVVMNGGEHGYFSSGATGRFGATINGCWVVQNMTIAGMEFRGGPMQFETYSSARIICRTNAIGMTIGGGGQYLAQFCEFTGNTSHGIYMTGNSLASGQNSMQLLNCQVTGNGGSGIFIESQHNHINAAGSTISNNSAWGVNMAGAKQACFNDVISSAGVVMASNTSGDFSLDGVAATTLAALRADADKDLTDAIRHNRLAEA
jgi:hypothetical protein